MKFNAKQIKSGELEGKWAVFKGTSTYWPATARDTKAEAEDQARIRSAEWHIEQVKELLSKVGDTVEPHEIQNVGAQADDVLDVVVDWSEKHDPRHDSMDPRSWTC